MRAYLKIVVAGAVDSGKSTLIGRFLYETGSLNEGAREEIENLCRRLNRNFEFAYLTDSFEEERSNQLTIDTTQIFCRDKNGEGLIFIDVPGHRELIKNMLSGTSYADAAILVVDISKPIEGQTKTHALILKFLGIDRIIVALNKIDLYNFDEAAFIKAEEEIKDFFQRIELTPEYFLPISAKDGYNLSAKCKEMPWYKGKALSKILNMHFNKTTGNNFIFSVQDIYDIHNEKIAVGPVISGRIAKGQTVNILPLKRKSKIKAIKIFNKETMRAMAPENIGLVLEDMTDLTPGFILSKEDTLNVSTEIKAKIFCFGRLDLSTSLRLECLNQCVSVRINQIKRIWDVASSGSGLESATADNLDFFEAAILTEEPIVTERFTGKNSLGRFILILNNEICAVGIVI